MIVWVMWLATALALFAALSYLLIQLNVFAVGDVQTAGAPAIPLVASVISDRWPVHSCPKALALDRWRGDQRVRHRHLHDGVFEPSIGHVSRGWAGLLAVAPRLYGNTSSSQSKTSCAIKLMLVAMAWASAPSAAVVITNFDRLSGLR